MVKPDVKSKLVWSKGHAPWKLEETVGCGVWVILDKPLCLSEPSFLLSMWEACEILTCPKVSPPWTSCKSMHHVFSFFSVAKLRDRRKHSPPPQTAFPGAHLQVIFLLRGRLTSGVPMSIWKCSSGGKALCYKASTWAMLRGCVTQPHTVTRSPESFVQKPLSQPALCRLQSHRTELFSRC